MSDEQHPLERLSRRGEARGADAVMAAARDEADPSSARGRSAALVAAAVVVVLAVAGAVALSGDGDGTEIETVDQPVPGVDQTTTTAVPGTTAPASSVQPVFAFDPLSEAGVVAVSGLGDPDGPSLVPVATERGQEGSTQMAVSSDGATVFHTAVMTGCQTDIVESRLGLGSVGRIENATAPALDGDGRLAYATGDGCTTEAHVLAVRDTATGEEVRVDVDVEELGVPPVIVDVEWVGDRVAVLVGQTDAAGVEQRTVFVYEVPSDGSAPRQVQWVVLPWVGSGGPGGGVVGIEPLPGSPQRLVAAVTAAEGDGSSFYDVDLATGDRWVASGTDGTVTSFAVRSLDDILYSVELSGEGSDRLLEELRWLHDEYRQTVASGLNSVAVPARP